MHRFFIPQPLAEQITIMGTDAHHIGRVLRMKPGERLLVADAEGQSAIARIVKIASDRVLLSREDSVVWQTEPPVNVWLAQGMPKADKLELIVQKAVELGINGIIPLQTDNAIVRYDAAKAQAKIERWQKIAAEAAKQSGRERVPTVRSIQTLEQLLNNLDQDTLAIMPYEHEGARTIGDVLHHDLCPHNYLVIIGPEGGFTPAEAALCQERGVQTVTLGPRILRTETAALATIAIIMYQSGDLGTARD